MIDELKGKKFVVGTKQTVRAIRNLQTKTVLIANDANSYMKEKILNEIKDTDVDVVYVESMSKLGNACNICRSAVVAAIINSQIIKEKEEQ